MINFERNKITLNKENVKYIAKLTNLDKRYVFKREFVNKSYISIHNDTFILEFAFNDNTKKYFIVDSIDETYTEETYDNLKKMKNKDPESFCIKYFF